MTEMSMLLTILVVDDDPEVLQQLEQTMPKSIEDYEIFWEYCENFSKAIQLIKLHRYDAIITDIYLDRKGVNKKDLTEDDIKAYEIIDLIRGTRFCPIVAFTDGIQPPTFPIGPFVSFADKAGGDAELINRLTELIKTGVPSIARKLHNELDRTSGSYLWNFLEANWNLLNEQAILDQQILERLIRRRAAIQLGRIVGDEKELETVEGLEFYIWPPISGEEYRLGDIVRHKESKEIRVLMTPHCHLVVQTGDEKPRADHILTVRSFPAKDIIRDICTDKNGNMKNPWRGTNMKKMEKIRRRINSPAELGRPNGRYWFLPAFLSIPDLYCDFLQLESLRFEDLQSEFERIATLDAPFAEALQSCFTRFYSAVGIPNLDPEKFFQLTKE